MIRNISIPSLMQVVMESVAETRTQSGQQDSMEMDTTKHIMEHPRQQSFSQAVYWTNRVMETKTNEYLQPLPTQVNQRQHHRHQQSHQQSHQRQSHRHQQVPHQRIRHQRLAKTTFVSRLKLRAILIQRTSPGQSQKSLTQEQDVFSTQGKYDKPNAVETREVCLKHDTEYKFIIEDSTGDGICCGDSDAEWATGYYGDGYYKAYYGASNTELFPPGGVLDRSLPKGFGSREERTFTTPKAQTTGKRCRRKEKPNVDMKFKVKRQGKIRQIKRKCKFIAGMRGIAVAKSYCRKRNMNVVWEQGQKKPILADMCPETCGRLGVGKCRFLKDQ